MANKVKKQTEKAKADISKQTVEATSNDQANSVDAQATTAATQDENLASTEQAANATGTADVQSDAASDKQGADLASSDQATEEAAGSVEEYAQNVANVALKLFDTLSPTAKPSLAKALKVVAKADKFRRGGHVFDRTETTLLLADLTDEQIKQIKDEPLLVVTEVDIEVKAEVSAE